MPPQDPKSESFAALFEASHAAPRRRIFDEGDELDVVVVQLGRDAVFVELDGKQEGFIEAKDLTSAAGELTVKVGSRITARVVEMGGRPGAVRLVPVFVRPPVDAAPDEGAASAVVAPSGGALAVGTRVTGAVALVERYGVFMQITPPAGAAAPSRRGLRGLIPTAELGVPRGADLHKHFPVGKELEAKVVAIDERGRIRLSIVELAADDERRAFESFGQKSKPGTEPAGAVRFGTLGDLLSKAGSRSSSVGAGEGRTSPPGTVVRRKR